MLPGLSGYEVMEAIRADPLVADTPVLMLTARKEEADRIQITVQDTGIGLSAETQTHIFDRFYRVDSSRDRHRGGTGLGLSIVKHILNQHGATIHVESTLGEGSTFTIFFKRLRKKAEQGQTIATVM